KRVGHLGWQCSRVEGYPTSHRSGGLADSLRALRHARECWIGGAGNNLGTWPALAAQPREHEPWTTRTGSPSASRHTAPLARRGVSDARLRARCRSVTVHQAAVTSALSCGSLVCVPNQSTQEGATHMSNRIDSAADVSGVRPTMPPRWVFACFN